MWRGKDFDVTGFDYSPQAIAEAKKNYPQGRFFVGDLKTMPPQGPYDCVVCVGVLHYFLPDLSPLKTLLTGSTTNLLIITLNSDVDLGIFKDWGKIISARFENRKGWVIVFRL